MAWHKFRKNYTALFFICFVILAIIVSVLGYLITPDKSPYANEQNLEFATQYPGFSAQILLVHKNEETEKINFLKKMFFGYNNPYLSIPCENYYFKNDEIIICTSIEADSNYIIEKKYKLIDVVYPISLFDDSTTFSNGKIIFKKYDNSLEETDIETLKEVIKEKHIIQKKFLLGTDRYGRDVLSQIIIGTRVSLSVGFISVFISLCVGILLGALAGYFRGWVDNLIIWFINVIWAIPTLLLVIAITFALGKGFWQIFIAVGLTMWVEVARVVRGQVLSIREKEYIEATKALGFSNLRIIFKHILPNVISPVIVISAANFASAILIEAGLSFLGIGVQPPMPSWGTMIKEHYSYIILDKAYLAIFPGIAIMLMVMAFMIIGNGLRDALDVKTISKK